jgi:hypothetical protein
MTAGVLTLDDPEFWQDPYPSIAHARSRGRVARSPEGEIVLLAIDDVEAASARPDFVTLGVAALDRLGMTDGPFHGKLDTTGCLWFVTVKDGKFQVIDEGKPFTGTIVGDPDLIEQYTSSAGTGETTTAPPPAS